MTRDDHTLWARVAATVKPLRKAVTKAVTTASARSHKMDFAPISIPVSGASLDLHGMTVADAHIATLDFIAQSKGRAKITIITGKSGQIKREFERWVEGIPKIHSVTPKSDGGAFTLRILKRYR